MMTEREKFIIRAALIYARSNVDDLNDAFSGYFSAYGQTATITVGGEKQPQLTETEIEQTFFMLK